MLHEITLSLGETTLRPLTHSDADLLHPLVDALMWSGLSTPYPPTLEDMRAHFENLLANPNVIPFAVEHRGKFVGRTTFYDLVETVKVEIGNTIFTRDVWGTHVNTASKLLLFQHGFEQMGLERIALRCDHRNIRSHRAIRKLGASYEGTLRRFRRGSDGTLVDVDYFSLVREEWPAAQNTMRGLLGLATSAEASLEIPDERAPLAPAGPSFPPSQTHPGLIPAEISLPEGLIPPDPILLPQESEDS